MRALITNRQHLGALLLLIATITGCSSPTMEMQMTSSANLNMNQDNEPLTVVVRIYQLERAETFKAASFDELWENDLATLGDAVLVKEEIVMNPADTRKFEMSPHDDTRFVAIMAGFREKNGDRWKDIASVSNSWLGRRIGNSYQVELRGNEIVFE